MTGLDILPEERKQKLDSLFEGFSVIAEDTYVYLCDMKYDVSRWSKMLVDTYGLPSEYMKAAGDIWEEHIHPEDRETYHKGIDDIFSGRAQGHDMQYRAQKENGEYDVCTCRGIVLKDENGVPEYFGGAIRNHGEQSHIDTLTGLRNQYGFFEDLKNRINKKYPARLWVIGIERLTEINEVYGYHTGNKMLQHFGRYLMDHVGNRGGTYRLDGSKFAVITETLGSDNISSAYEDIRSHFREGIVFENVPIMLELNSSFLALEDFNTDDQTIYSCLDFAYDESRFNRHGDITEFHNDLNNDAKQRTEKLHLIRNSISHGYSGFYLLYQPIFGVKDEKVKGAEALLRWSLDDQGMVPPDEFIPLLEKDPLFPRLGEWILRMALKESEKALLLNRDFVINVNISYSQLEKADFTDMVFNIIRETGFPPENLCLEITERCRLLDMDLLKNTVVALKAGGVKIALDDFGTGYSSMGLVKNLPFDTIKVDRGFVKDIEEDEKDKMLVKSFTEMAGTFGARVCVEGVETAGIRDILKEYNVHSFQGYYYSRPVRMEKILEDLG
ncbi:MAG: EAL domain-containing protein [Lachnospiraceae bacterium]|nr:EAL domain-containing protein [Lachnospiraceae bacterium]